MSLEKLKEYVELHRALDAGVELVRSKLMTIKLELDTKIYFSALRPRVLFKIRHYLENCFAQDEPITNSDEIYALLAAIEDRCDTLDFSQWLCRGEYSHLDIVKRVLGGLGELPLQEPVTQEMELQELTLRPSEGASGDGAAALATAVDQSPIKIGGVEALDRYIETRRKVVGEIQKSKDCVMFSPVMSVAGSPDFTIILDSLSSISGFRECFGGVDATTLERQDFIERANNLLARVLFEIRFLTMLRFDIQCTVVMPFLVITPDERDKGLDIIRDKVTKKLSNIQRYCQQIESSWLQDVGLVTDIGDDVDVMQVLSRHLESTEHFDQRWCADMTLVNLTIDRLSPLRMIPLRVILLAAVRQSARNYLKTSADNFLKKAQTSIDYWRLIGDLSKVVITDLQQIAGHFYENLPPEEWRNLCDLLSDESILRLSSLYNLTINRDHGQVSREMLPEAYSQLVCSLDEVMPEIRSGRCTVESFCQQVKYPGPFQGDQRARLTYVLAEYELLQKRWQELMRQCHKEEYLQWLCGLSAVLSPNDAQVRRAVPGSFGCISGGSWVLWGENSEEEQGIYAQLSRLDEELLRIIASLIVEVFELSRLERYISETKMLCLQVEHNQSYREIDGRLKVCIEKYGNTGSMQIHLNPAENLLDSMVIAGDTGQLGLILDSKTAALIYFAEFFKEKVIAPARTGQLEALIFYELVSERFLQFFELIQSQPCAIIYYELCSVDPANELADVCGKLKTFFHPDFVLNLFQYESRHERGKFFDKSMHRVLSKYPAITAEGLQRNLQDMRRYHEGINESRGDKAYPDWQKKQAAVWEVRLGNFQIYLDCFVEFDGCFAGLRAVEDLRQSQQVTLINDRSVEIFDLKIMLLVYLRKQVRLLLAEAESPETKEKINAYKSFINYVTTRSLEGFADIHCYTLPLPDLNLKYIKELLSLDNLKELYIQHVAVITQDYAVLNAWIGQLELNDAHVNALIYNIRCLDQEGVSQFLVDMPEDIKQLVTEQIMKHIPWSPEWEVLLMKLYHRHKVLQCSLRGFTELLDYGKEASRFISSAQQERGQVLSDFAKYLEVCAVADSCVESVVSLEPDTFVPLRVLGCQFIDIKASVAHYLRTHARAHLEMGTMTLAIAKSHLAFLKALPEVLLSNVPKLLESVILCSGVKAHIVRLCCHEFIRQLFQAHPGSLDGNQQCIEHAAQYCEHFLVLKKRVELREIEKIKSILESLLSQEVSVMHTPEIKERLVDLQQALASALNIEFKVVAEFYIFDHKDSVEKNIKRLEADIANINRSLGSFWEMLAAIRAQSDLTQLTLTPEQQALLEDNDIEPNAVGIQAAIDGFSQKLMAKHSVLVGLQFSLRLADHEHFSEVRLALLKDLQQGMQRLWQCVAGDQLEAEEHRQHVGFAAALARTPSAARNPRALFSYRQAGPPAASERRPPSPTRSASGDDSL